ncbi:hypothetical protein CDAR_260451 [Caerostris darwini]|uniref:Uncharacterized protein n=1 Tax=Caerostris darwini TaxID=1538125 RepID=A0AAV4NU62_9ARAC|nr:hypothetical protein CDAR_260451 [Caerostris darwini]
MFPQIDDRFLEPPSNIPTFFLIFLVIGIILILGSCLATLWRVFSLKTSTRTGHPPRLLSIYLPQPPAPSFANLQVDERQLYPDSFILMQQSQSAGFGIHDPPPKYSAVVHQESSDGQNERCNYPAIIEVERTTSSPPECARPESSPPESSHRESSPPGFLPPAYSPPEYSRPESSAECSRRESSPPGFSPPAYSPPEYSRPESSAECSRRESSPPGFSPPAYSPPEYSRPESSTECSRPESSPPEFSPPASSPPQYSPPESFSPKSSLNV